MQRKQREEIDRLWGRRREQKKKTPKERRDNWKRILHVGGQVFNKGKGERGKKKRVNGKTSVGT